MYTSNEILELIQAPQVINGMDQLNDIVKRNDCYTLIEKPFFTKISQVVKQICENNVEGDVVIVGVFKGGGALYLKSLFEEYGVYKKWWLLDSFSGFNKPTLKHANDIEALKLFNDKITISSAPSAQSVLELFEKHGLADNLHIVEGFIEDTLQKLPIEKVSFLHIDVDFFEPTDYALRHLYPKLSKGGWVAVDDYNVTIFDCKTAVDAYRKEAGIDSPIVEFGKYPVGWEKR